MGGSTDSILRKTSATDYATAWVDETDAANNTAYGASTQVGTTGTFNTAYGVSAQQVLTTGGDNTAGVGKQRPVRAPKGLTSNATMKERPSGKDGCRGAQRGVRERARPDKGTSVGYNAVAHSNALALGADTEARGYGSTALGRGAIATLDDQIMLGAATAPGSTSATN